jgi:hypothetical protein
MLKTDGFCRERMVENRGYEQKPMKGETRQQRARVKFFQLDYLCPYETTADSVGHFDNQRSFSGLMVRDCVHANL